MERRSGHTEWEADAARRLEVAAERLKGCSAEPGLPAVGSPPVPVGEDALSRLRAAREDLTAMGDELRRARRRILALQTQVLRERGPVDRAA